MTTKKEFMDLINETVNVENDEKRVYLVFKPKIGWYYEVSAPVAEVLDDNIIWISNAFEYGASRPMKLYHLVHILKTCKDEQEVAFEIYGFNGTTNEQIICRSLDLSDIDIEETSDNIRIILSTNTIGDTNTGKFVVQRLDNNMHIRWDANTVVFDSVDEANKFISTFPKFVEGINYSIVPLTKDLLSFKHILYKDLINTDSYKEELASGIYTKGEE